MHRFKKGNFSTELHIPFNLYHVLILLTDSEMHVRTPRTP